MKFRRIIAWIAIGLAAANTLWPLAATAAQRVDPLLAEVCSVNGTRLSNASGFPAPRPAGKHQHVHCDFCPSSGANNAALQGAPTNVFAPTAIVYLIPRESSSHSGSTAAYLLAPSRAPPVLS
jgi:hypothetical protein